MGKIRKKVEKGERRIVFLNLLYKIDCLRGKKQRTHIFIFHLELNR